MHTIGSGPFAAVEQTAECIERRMRAMRTSGLVWYGLRLRGSGLLVGNCGVFAGRTGVVEPEIGYEIRHSHQGRGLACEAAQAVLEECFSSGVHRVWATIRPANTASLNIAARLGMVVQYARAVLLAPLLGKQPETITAGQMSYDLRRLRAHGVIQRIPHTHRYRLTPVGHEQALFLTRVHDRLIRTGLADLADPDRPTALRTATRAYENALENCLRRTGLAV